MSKRIGIFSFLTFWTITVWGQPFDHQKTVEAALLDIEEQYQVRFSYSKDIVPHDDLVVLAYQRKSLTEVLEDLGSQTGIIYNLRGTRVVLNYDPSLKKPHPAVMSQTIELPKTQGDDIDLSESFVLQNSPEMPDAIKKEPRHKTSSGKIDERNLRREFTFERAYEAKELQLAKKQEKQWAQISFLPLEGLIGQKSDKINHFSFNVLAGYTGGLEGIEVGGIANSTRRDVKGLQLAGFANYVGGNVEGGQIAGFGNFNKGIMRGIQVGGFSNVNEQTDGIQIAGGFNLNRRISRGYQIAGFFNAGRNVNGGQIAGFLNVLLGNAYFQTAGFCNIAENVDVQISGLVNVAKTVRHFQIGLINVADSVGDFSFGFLNLIKKGYNKVEFSVGEALYANVAVKLGTRKFYNIFQVGTNFKRNILHKGYTWGYGYGFGFFLPVASGFKLNPEILVSNVQEKRIFKPELNLLNQVKLLFHFSEGKNMEIFAGPTANFMISKLRIEDGSLVGTQIAPYTLFERTFFGPSDSFTTKFWIGFNAGIRI